MKEYVLSFIVLLGILGWAILIMTLVFNVSLYEPHKPQELVKEQRRVQHVTVPYDGVEFDCFVLSGNNGDGISCVRSDR